MYLLDTNICIYAMKNKYPALTKKLFQIPPSEIFISVITVGELECGCVKSHWGERSRAVMQTFLSAYTVLPFGEKDAIVFGRLQAVTEKKGQSPGPYDIQIAAQGILRGLTIVTHDTSDFSRIPGAILEDWVE